MAKRGSVTLRGRSAIFPSERHDTRRPRLSAARTSPVLNKSSATTVGQSELLGVSGGLLGRLDEKAIPTSASRRAPGFGLPSSRAWLIGFNIVCTWLSRDSNRGTH